MSLIERVSAIIDPWLKPRLEGERIVLPTFSYYPSNSMIQIFIEGGVESFTVSDGGGAVDVLHGAGGLNVDHRRLLTNLARRKDMRVTSAGWIVASGIATKQLTSAISEVAETSRRAAELLLKHFKVGEAVDFRRAINTTLETQFHDTLVKSAHLLGASNKVHTFDYQIRLPSDASIVLDTVVPDASSINAALVAHLDLKNAKRADVRQAIVFDDRENWKSADLALLSIAAPPIAFSRFPEQLQRLLH